MHCRRHAAHLTLVALCGDWREALAYRVGEGHTYWWTSNAEYAGGSAEPRGMDAAADLYLDAARRRSAGAVSGAAADRCVK